MAATWGTNVWGANSWESETVAVSLTGFSVTSSLGTLAYAQSVEGWGRDTWGSNQWGEDAVDVSVTGFAVSGSLGSITATPITIASPTGIEITASLGTPTISRLDMIFDITGPAAMSAGLGVLNINDGADHSQGVGSLLATGSVGALSHEMTYELGSLSITASVGSPTITSAKLYVITATNLATCSVGSLTVDDMSVGLTGLQATSSVGSLTVDDMSIGLSGLEMTGALGIISPLHYRNDTITGSTSYTSVDITGSTSYTIDEHAA